MTTCKKCGKKRDDWIINVSTGLCAQSKRQLDASGVGQGVAFGRAISEPAAKYSARMGLAANNIGHERIPESRLVINEPAVAKSKSSNL
jgi:hypothetical protein